MIQKNTISTMLIAASAIVLAAAPRAWSAPDAPLPAAPQAQAAAEVKNEVIQIKNMPPSWMLPLLISKPSKPRDTTALPAGAVLGFSIRGGVKADIKKGTPEGDKFEADQKARYEAALKNPNGLPEGVESLTPDDATGTLQARGTAGGINRVRTLIGFWDNPLRRVEVEVQTVRVNRGDMEALTRGAAFAHPDNPVTLGFLRGQDYRAPLQELVDANRASTLLQARAVVINNLSSSFRSDGRDGVGQDFGPTSEVQVTPTINNDDTITIVMESATKLPGIKAPEGTAKMKTAANVRDGETIILGRLDEQDAKQATITFITARIVRRADEKAEKK